MLENRVFGQAVGGGDLEGDLGVTHPKSLSLFMIRFLLFLYPASVKYHISHQNRLISL